MKSRSPIFAICSSALLLCSVGVATANAQMQLRGEKTYFIFTRGVELPGGTILPPGSYTFRVTDSAAGRFVVQVLTADESELLATVLTITAPYRSEPSENSVITFGEASPVAPRPLKYWYYQGQYAGHEFVYPKEQAERIARDARAYAMARTAPVTPVTSAESVAQAPVQPTEPSGATAEADAIARAEAPAAEVTTAESEVQPTTSYPGPQPIGTSGAIARRQLPRTAGFDPLVGLIGMMSFAGFIALRMRAR